MNWRAPHGSNALMRRLQPLNAPDLVLGLKERTGNISVAIGAASVGFENQAKKGGVDK